MHLYRCKRSVSLLSIFDYNTASRFALRFFNDRYCPTYKIGPVYTFNLRFCRDDFCYHSVPACDKNFLTVFDVVHDVAEMMLKLSNIGFYHV